ncbi:transglutaminase-like cysteine peptidase [Glycocaulis abyssi]|uniref:Transglutaminase-like cysteine peptidase n=1 Tax=Glycocaulis abyssi TaxID=1433403 RepID=A0ABV9NF65_9PROT
MKGMDPGLLARAWRSLAISCLAGFAVTACATTPQASSHMPAAGVAMPPAGLIDMCRRAPEICGAAQGETASGLLLASAETASTEATGGTSLTVYGDGAKALRAAPDDTLLQERSAARDVEGGTAPGGETGEENAVDGPALDADGRLVAAPGLFATLNRVNQSINMQIRPREDQELYGVEDHWTLPLTLEGTAEGDCEDYALEKRQALIAAGVPDSALFLAVGYSLATGRHAVLVVSTDQGDYVLDNMTPYILPWADTPYHWTARQMPGDLLSWRHMAAQVS